MQVCSSLIAIHFRAASLDFWFLAGLRQPQGIQGFQYLVYALVGSLYFNGIELEVSLSLVGLHAWH